MKSIKLEKFKIKNNCVSFGNFDGVHKGHRSIIDLLKKEEHNSLNSVILNIKSSTLEEEDKDILYTEDEKKFILENYGPMYYVEEPREMDLVNMEAEKFIKEIIVGKLDAKKIIIGEDYKFGKNKKGNIDTLRELAPMLGFDIVVCNTVNYKDRSITSNRIKEEIKKGNIIDANKMLVEPYFIIGKVIHGKALGRTVGMPTANLSTSKEKIKLKHGVYATLSKFDGEVYQGLTNIGLRPSVDDYKYTTIETFIMDFSRDIYDKKIKIEIHKYIRGVIKFNDLKEVKQQVEKDIHQIENCFNNQVIYSS